MAKYFWGIHFSKTKPDGGRRRQVSSFWGSPKFHQKVGFEKWSVTSFWKKWRSKDETWFSRTDFLRRFWWEWSWKESNKTRHETSDFSWQIPKNTEIRKQTWLKKKWLFAGPDRGSSGAKKLRMVFPHISVVLKPPQLPYGAKHVFGYRPRWPPKFSIGIP